MSFDVTKVHTSFVARANFMAGTKINPTYKEIESLIDKITSQRKSKVILDAIEFAGIAHEGQVRKGTTIPYIIHPLRVGLILSEFNCSDKIVAAGILHDTVEDTPVTSEDLKYYFGDAVTAFVEGASEPDKSDTWENRKQHTIEYLKSAPLGVLLVSCADKLDNIKDMKKSLETIGEKHWSIFKRGREQQSWYYKSLAEAFLFRANSSDALKRMAKEFSDEVQKVFNSEAFG